MGKRIPAGGCGARPRYYEHFKAQIKTSEKKWAGKIWSDYATSE